MRLVKGLEVTSGVEVTFGSCISELRKDRLN